MIRPPLPPLALRARLSELEGCWLEIRCSQCGKITTPAIGLLMRKLKSGHHYLGAIIPRLVCETCRAPPAEVYLNETHNRCANGGSPPGWSVLLHPLPRQRVE